MSRSEVLGLALGALAAVFASCTTSPRPAAGPTTGQAAEAPPAEAGHGRGADAVDQLLLRPLAADPTVSVALWVPAGSQDDPPGKEGLAHLTASLIARGATAERSYPEVLAALYPLASTYSARVDKEMTTLSGRTHRDNLGAYLDLFEGAFLKPGFDPSDFERLRSDQRNYLQKVLRYASDEELGKAALHAFVFEGTRYAHPPEGTVQGLASLTLEDVRAFYRDRYGREAAVLALAGGYPAEAAQRAEAARSRLPAGDRRPPPPPPEPAPIAGLEVLLVAKPGADASISFGFPLDVRRGERDFYALWLANSWLGEHRNSSSHLFQVIREARGLNYGDYSYIEWFAEGGQRDFPPPSLGRRRQLFEAWIRTLPNDQALFALRAALRELTRLAEQGLSEEEFDLTRSFLGKYVLHFADTTSTRLGYALDDLFYGVGGEGHLARFREAMASLTREEVNAAIRRHLQATNLKVAIVTGQAEALKAALLSGAPTPITYASEKPAEVLAEDREIAAYPLKVEPEKLRIVPVEQMFER